MHAAVWSQPISSRKLTRSHSHSKAPESFAGKTVLGVGIALTMIGGLLGVLGATGYFVRGDNKYYLGFGAPLGVCTLLAGLAGTRSITNRRTSLRYVVAFFVLGMVTFGASVAMAVLGSIVLTRPSLLLLTRVIAFVETSLSAVVATLTALGIGVTIVHRDKLLNTSKNGGNGEDGNNCPDSLRVSESELADASGFSPEYDRSHI